MSTHGHEEILTFEEFKERANRKPAFEGAWICQLTQAIMDNDIKVPYLMFDLYNQEERLFLSFVSLTAFMPVAKDAKFGNGFFSLSASSTVADITFCNDSTLADRTFVPPPLSSNLKAIVISLLLAIFKTVCLLFYMQSCIFENLNKRSMYWDILIWIVRNLGKPIMIAFAVLCILLVIFGRPMECCRCRRDDK